MAKPKPARTGPSLGQEVIALAILGSGILLLLALSHIYELAIGHWVAGDEKDFLGLITN